MSAFCNLFSHDRYRSGASLMTYNALVDLYSNTIQRYISLLIYWLCGLCTGCFLFYACGPFILSLMPCMPFQQVSIVGLLASIFLPFLFTYFSIVTGRSSYIFFVCFLKTLSFGFTGTYLVFTYLSANWLIQFLFLFSDCCCLPIFMWIWLSFFDSLPKSVVLQRFVFCFCVGFLVTLFDFNVVSPFMYGLF